MKSVMNGEIWTKVEIFLMTLLMHATSRLRAPQGQHLDILNSGKLLQYANATCSRMPSVFGGGDCGISAD